MTTQHRQCAKCSQPIPEHKGRRGNQIKYCSKSCRDEYWRNQQQGHDSKAILLNNNNKGALGELKVTCDLLEKGFSVFRSVSPSCDCDLVIMKDGILKRVEVTTGYRGMSGKLFFVPHKKENYDILALIIKGQVVYSPSLNDFYRKVSLDAVAESVAS